MKLDNLSFTGPKVLWLVLFDCARPGLGKWVDEKNLQSKTTYLQIAVISLKTITENWDRRDKESSTKREGDCFSAIIVMVIKSFKKNFWTLSSTSYLYSFLSSRALTSCPNRFGEEPINSV